MPDPYLVAAGLAESLPNLTARRGRRTVVKLGGSLIDDPQILKGILVDLVLLNIFGQQVIVVHGGGKAIDRALADAGIAPKKVDGKRVTDQATLDIVVRVLGRDLSNELVQQTIALGVHAVAISPALIAHRVKEPDLGFVGDIERVDVKRLLKHLRAKAIPFVPSLADSIDGGWLNINADEAAGEVAIRCQADYLTVLSDVPGVLRVINDPASLIHELSVGDAQKLVNEHVISEGMIPKIVGCLNAAIFGTTRTQIIDGRVPHALLLESLTGQCPGTEIIR